MSSAPADLEQPSFGVAHNGLRSSGDGFPRVSPTSPRDGFWEHAKNALGIARLLVHDGRPESLVETACRTAVEAASRAALEQAGMRFDGDAESALVRLAAPRDVLRAPVEAGARGRLEACERIVGWVAAYLRSEAPERSWGY